MLKIKKYRALLFVGLLVSSHGFGEPAPTTAPPELPVLEPSGRNPLDGFFIGFGAEWDSRAYTFYGMNDADFSLIRERIKWMRLPLTRIMMLSRWCTTGNGNYNWNTPEMKMLLKELDICEELGISVILTDWGMEPNWMSIPDVTKIDDPKYAEIIGHYMDYLINEKKYHCIKYFVFTNEPRDGTRCEPWLAGLSNVAAEFKKRGLDRSVRLTGTDQSGNKNSLLKPMIQRLGPSIGAYDLHLYANQNHRFTTTEEAAKSGDIRTYLMEAWQEARAMDPDKSKPLLVGEGGYWIHDADPAKKTGAGNNPLNRDWHYGLFMASYAIQAVQAGSWGLSAWMLDDDSHQNFNWGMWGNKKENFALKPWFYVWALLTRSFPPGSTFTLLDSPKPGVQIIAAKLPTRDENSTSWSICVVNFELREVAFRLRIPHGGEMRAVRYLYSEKDALVDERGFPKPVEHFDAKWAMGVPITSPPESVTFLTPADLADVP